ncbi:O-antigen export protein [Desulfosarcina cetonica]
MVPITLDYLDANKYGIWLTINSIIAWVGFFDIGIGNGLRNKLSEALANDDLELSKTYISTTYFILFIIITSVSVVFFTVDFFFDWVSLLSISNEDAKEIQTVIRIIFVLFSIRFILNVIEIVLAAKQVPALNNLFNLSSNIVALVAIFILTKMTKGNLIYLSIAYCSAPILILSLSSYFLYSGRLSKIKPEFGLIDFKKIKSLARIGGQFFIIQVAYLVIFSTDNLIIIKILGPVDVTSYNLALRYFSLPIVLFTIVVTPFWSACTEAYIIQDYEWIKKSIKKLLVFWSLLFILIICLLINSNRFYQFWVGERIQIYYLLSMIMALYAILSTWNNLFVYFINGIGKIRLQVIISIIGMVLNIPLSIYLAKYQNLGNVGVILGTCICLCFGSILFPLQSIKILNHNDSGIWQK